MIRRVFWNFKTAFMGWPLIKDMPRHLLKYPVLIGVPMYTVIVA
jgi:hypothetical protein